MRFLGKVFLFLIFFIVFGGIFGLGYLGFVPGLSAILGSTKPRDLGINYTEADLSSGRTKSQIEYVSLPAQNSLAWQTSGSRPVTTAFSSAEITAIMNNKPGSYYPYKNVQVKFNADGTGEISGILVKSRIPAYGATFGAPKEAVDFAMKFLPENPVFYLKGKATLIDNKVGFFEPQKFEIGRAPMPLTAILAFVPPRIVHETYALDISGMTAELAKVQNKRALIIDFINSRLSQITGFYAKSARFEENKLNFDGTLPEKEATVR